MMPTERSAPALLAAIAQCATQLSPVRIMNVCGGHERTIAMSGLRSLLPAGIRLIAGPGCPVCVCPQEDIALAMHWAISLPVTLLCFGDMLRVPVSSAERMPRSLADARAHGADVRVIASPQEAVALARSQPERTMIFHAVGFETTMAPVAATIASGLPENLLLLLSGRLTWPAVSMMLQRAPSMLDGLIAPGHVATIMGPGEWSFIPDQYGLPVAVAGFTPVSLLMAIHTILAQRISGESSNHNGYPAAVRPEGNPAARRWLEHCFEVVDAPWRGIGVVKDSGYRLRPAWVEHDAMARLGGLPIATGHHDHTADMPPGCDCASVILGEKEPSECRLYGRGCRPAAPVGPCMVADEGACRIAWDAGIRATR